MIHSFPTVFTWIYLLFYHHPILSLQIKSPSIILLSITLTYSLFNHFPAFHYTPHYKSTPNQSVKWEGLNPLLTATILHPLIDFLSLRPLNFLLAFHASSLSLVHLRLISLCHLEFVHIPYNNNLSRSLWAAHCHATMSSACPDVWCSLLCPYMAYVGICDAASPSLFPIQEGLHFGAYSTQHRRVRDASLLNHSTSHPHIVYHPHCAAFSPHTTLGGREGYCYAAWVLPTALHGWETSLYLFLTQHLCEAIPLCCTPIPGYPTQRWRCIAGVPLFPLCSVRGLKDAVGQVLEAVVQLGGDGVDGVVDEGVKVRLKLLLSHADMEATL